MGERTQIILVILLILLGIVILGIYSQGLHEEMILTNNLTIEEVILEKSVYGDSEAVNFIVFEVGKLIIENSRTPDKEYTLPEIFGCLEINDEASEDPQFVSYLERTALKVEYLSKDDAEKKYGKEEVYISKGDRKEFKIIVRTENLQAPSENVDKEAISEIVVYKKYENKLNPFDTEPYSKNRKVDCKKKAGKELMRVEILTD